MNHKARINPAFQHLLTTQPLHPFSIEAVLHYLTDQYANALLLDGNDEAEQDADTCKIALERLLEFKQAGKEMVYLNVAEDLPEQIIQGPALNP